MNMSPPCMPKWRRLNELEVFKFDFLPGAPGKGYVVESDCWMFGHENCACYRSLTPETVLWYLPHCDYHHGKYALTRDETLKETWLKHLEETVAVMRPGWIVIPHRTMSCGALLR